MTTESLLLILFGWLGLSVGSFLNVCIYRLPIGKSVMHPPSSCPRCGYSLRWYDNIPVLSWVFLRARCRGCKAPISVRYPIVELITLGVFLLHYFVFGWSILMAVRLAFACALIVLFAIDLEHQILPNVITLPGLVIGLVASVFLPPGFVDALLGAVVGGGVLFAIGEGWSRLRGIEAMGFGDVKMLAMVGAFVGLKGVILTFILSSFIGGITGAVLILMRKTTWAGKVPFGTFLALAALVASLWGEQIVNWYIGLYV